MATPILGLHSATPKVTDPCATSRHSVEGKRLTRRANWVEGWWENIDSKPIYIRDREHLKRVCQEVSKRTGRTIIPKAFMKPASQGKGFEWSF